MKNFIYIYILLLFINSENSNAQNFERPPNFPKSMPLKLTTYECWSKEIRIENVWTAIPTSAQDILDATNWAMKFGYQIRASGFMHNWAPITVPPNNMNNNRLNRPPKLILLKTAKFLNKMRVISNEPGKSSFWAQPGITMTDLTEHLEWHKLGFSAIPAIGEITLGGVLAIGGHGTGVPARNEIKQPGHTYGTLSNLVMSFTAIVYNPIFGQYILQDFDRSDVKAKSFLTSLGRTFLTNVTMRVGPLQTVQCVSRTDILVDTLLAPPTHDSQPKLNSISYFIEKTGRVEVTIFPFTRRPWVKIWTLVDEKPLGSRQVTSPCNYSFSCRMNPAVAESIGKIAISSFLSKSIAFGQVMYGTLRQSLQLTNTENLWGESRNVFLYVKDSTLRVTANGYAILTSRANVQQVIYQSYKYYQDLLIKYANRQMFPINGPFEVRVSGIDDPNDVDIIGAESPAFSGGHPDPRRKHFDSVIWLNLITQHETPGANQFMLDFEQFCVHTFDGDSATLRVEWSKGWAYSRHRPWDNDTFLKNNIPNSLPNWHYAATILKNFDPYNVFTNDFLNIFV